MKTKCYTIKNSSTLHLAAVLVSLLVAAIGCSTNKPTENLLSAAGFKIMPATTPQQQAHLKTLPPDKVTMVVRDGKTYFVYPDPKAQVLYVGQQAQYDAYQKLRLQKQMAEEQVQAANENASDWGAWGGWGGVGFVEPVPVFRR